MRRRFISKTNKKSYLTIEALEDNLQVKFSKQILYSIDEGVTWEVLTANTYSTSINIGQCIMFKAKLIPSSNALGGDERNGIGTFTISKKCNLKGNCMSMLFGDDATSNLSLSGKGYAFYRLFYNCTNIIGVSDGFLPATTLANNCYGYMFFGCSSLTTAPELPATTLADSCYNHMFYGCTSLTTAPELPATTLTSSCYYGMFNGCTSLQAFYSKYTSSDNRCLIIDGVLNSFAPAGLTSYTIPNSVTSIGDYAFYDCSSLRSITIPDSITSIGRYAFEKCISLTSVTIPNSVTEIGDSAFYGCNGELIIDIKYVERDCYVYNYPSAYGWLHGANFSKITIGNSVTSIGDYAFYNCTSLTSVTIGNSVTEIGKSAFSGCSNLTSITIPDSVTSIGSDAFYECSSLISVTIPNSVTSIVYRTFYGCSSLTNLTIPDSVNSIGDAAFCNCRSLISVTIPDRVTSIWDSTFLYCTSLTSITIPDSVKWIREDAFSHCTSLKEVYCKPTTPPTGSNDMFSDNATGRKIYVPRASVNAYKAAQYWSGYAANIYPYDF